MLSPFVSCNVKRYLFLHYPLATPNTHKDISTSLYELWATCHIRIDPAIISSVRILNVHTGKPNFSQDFPLNKSAFWHRVLIIPGAIFEVQKKGGKQLHFQDCKEKLLYGEET